MLETILYTFTGGLFGVIIGIRIGYIAFGRWDEEMDDERENGETGREPKTV
jgi:hypothetical protein